ncbi:MAG: hypothetical protein KZQ93_09290 [Candidatus Thiodiazotropha sp. (ex Monitilora ramsayi)]|nr:hypothetical protein [Candidatus Thiodiazotropha sp. (ex Monitilora ramsayi)]
MERYRLCVMPTGTGYLPWRNQGDRRLMAKNTQPARQDSATRGDEVADTV